MKKIIFLVTLIFSLSISQAQAGLFEYYLGTDTSTNASSEEQADAVESLEYSHPNSVDYYPSRNYSSSNYNYSYYYGNNSYVYYNPCHNWSTGQVRPKCEYYIGYATNSGNYFKKQELLNILEDELDDVEDEIDYVSDIISDIKGDIRNAKRYTTDYYRYLRDRLEDDLEFFEERKDDLKDREDELEDEIRKVRRSSYSSSNYYYDYTGSSYYRTYNSYGKYSDYQYYYYYDPVLVNPDLEEVQDGRIYIK